MKKKHKRVKLKSTARRTFRYYLEELSKHKLLVAATQIALPLGILAQGFVLPWVLAQMIDTVTSGAVNADNVWDVFLPLILTAGGAMIFNQILQQVEVYSLWTLEIRAQYNLANKVFNTLAKQSMRFHNNRFGGSLVSQTNKFIGGFERLYDMLSFNLLPLLYNLLFTIVILGSTVPWFVVGLVVFVLIYIGVAALTYSKITHLNELHTRAETKQSGQLADSISNIMSVKSYAREKYEKSRFKDFSVGVKDAGLKMMKAVFVRDLCFGLLISSMMILLYVFFAGGNTIFGISVGVLVLMFSYTQNVLNQIFGVNRVFRDINKSLGDAHEITKILDLENDVSDVEGATLLGRAEGKVEFADVSFKHADGGEQVFEHLDLHIPAGQRVGLVGRSGSGKTTLTKLLLRFSDVQEGIITIDGQNVGMVTQESLRDNISYVPQETTLFHRSIADNIAYGKPKATRSEIIKAAKQANAWEFIKNLPDGLDTLTGERGVKLSGGQRQRIAIARAILKDAPILIMDEATASLDTESEKLIQEAIDRLMKGRTSIIIAHRLSTVAELDRVVVLDHGKIVEDGPHQDLIKKKGVYAKLWNKQTGTIK